MSRLVSFGDCSRVRYVGDRLPKIVGRIGVITRRRRGDNGAWCDVPDLPDEYRRFPAGDDRANHVVLFPEECESV